MDEKTKFQSEYVTCAWCNENSTGQYRSSGSKTNALSTTPNIGKSSINLVFIMNAFCFTICYPMSVRCLIYMQIHEDCSEHVWKSDCSRLNQSKDALKVIKEKNRAAA